MDPSIERRRWHAVLRGIVLLVSVALGACGGGGGSGGDGAPTLSSIGVAPATASIPRGTTQQFTANGSYSDGSTRDLTASVTWSTSDGAVASIDASGRATGANPGSATIRAADGSVTGSATLTVSAAQLASLAITPANATLGYLGATQQFRASGTYTDQTTADLTSSVTWISSDTGVATIGADGFVVARATSGSTILRAHSGAISASAALDVRTASVSGQISIPDSDMGWKPTVADLQAQGGGGKVRVVGTNIVTDVVPTGASAATFTLSGVPRGPITLVFDEGSFYDVFTAASKRTAVDVGSDVVSGVSFNLVYHWRELAGYPPPWGTNNTQGPVQWKAQFVSEDVAFIAFRLDIPSERIEVYRTLDRGANWTRVGQWIFDQTQWNTGIWAYPTWWQNFHFLDQNRGVLHASAAGIPCDSGGGYFQTSDGGQTWNLRTLPLTPTGYHVQTNAYARVGADRIIMVGTVGCGVQGYTSGFYDAIWESANAGVDWSLRWSSPRDQSGAFIGVDANGSGRAVAYRGGSFQQFLLRDAAGNWSAPQASGGIYNASRDVSMLDDSAWLISSGGTVPNGTYRSVNAGASWAKVSDGLVQDFDFVTQRKGFAQAGGPAYATYDGGISWRYQSAGGAIWPGFMDIWGFDRTHAAWAEVGFGDPNQRAQLFTYVEPATANVEAQARASSSDAAAARGAQGVMMGAYQLRNNGPVPISVRSVTLHASGSGNDATHITAVKLWLDRNGDGAVDAADTLLATGTFAADNGSVQLSTVASGLLEQFDVVQLLATYDMADTAGYTGTFRLSFGAADIVAQDDTGTGVSLSAPSGFVVTSRTITVAP